MKVASSFGHSKKTRLPPEPARECWVGSGIERGFCQALDKTAAPPP